MKLHGITIIQPTEHRRLGQQQQQARSTVTGGKGVLELQDKKENFATTQQDGRQKQSISTCEMRAERKNSVALGNGDKRHGKREDSWKTVRQQYHDEVPLPHAGSCLRLRLPFNSQFFVHFPTIKINCATLQFSASAHHNLELKIFRRVELYWSLSSP